ncbi:MAG: thiol peroxidase [Roseiflexaceae bacterium]
MERANAFDFIGPKTLVGPELKVGDKAPAFVVLGQDLKDVDSATLAGKPMLISVIPSVDTGVCDLPTKRFNDEAGRMGDKITLLTVSADLPFALRRYCGANEIKNLLVVSDHRTMSFGAAYGTYIKEVRLESRAVFVVDGAGVIRHAEYVPTAGQHPNYDAALAVLAKLV